MIKSRVIAVVAACCGAALAAAQGTIQWVPSYSAALDQAKNGHKLLMISFYTTWDEFSTPFDRLTLRNSEVVKLARNFAAVRLDVDKDGADQAKRFNITNYPTVLFLDSNEKVAGIIDGVESPDEFVKHSKVFMQDVADWTKFSARAKQDPKDVEAVASLGKIYADRYQIDQALASLKQAERLDKANSSDKITDLYNAIGDHYQNASQVEKAIKYFQRAADTSQVTDKKAYALLSIATVYVTIPDPPRPEDAVAPLEATLKLPGLKLEDRQLAERMLKMIKGGGQ